LPVVIPVGWLLNLMAFILLIVVMAKGKTKSGIMLLLLMVLAWSSICFFTVHLLYGAGACVRRVRAA